MIRGENFFGIKRSRIGCMALLLVLLSASGCEGPSAGQRQQQDKDFVDSLMKTPFAAVVAATVYYGEFGRWPGSVCDLEALDEEPFRDTDWASLQETAAFEPLPDGGLKIVWTDPHLRFTLTLSAPSGQKEDGFSQDGAQAISVRPTEFFG